VAVASVALALFFFVPLVPESIPGPLPLCSSDTCHPGTIHFTVSLSCYVTGDGPLTLLGDSYSPRISVNGNHLLYGCRLGNTLFS
jgi:hypothetical protein